MSSIAVTGQATTDVSYRTCIISLHTVNKNFPGNKIPSDGNATNVKYLFM
jgi:hypothetical protein